jgi:vacuolar-type H+-ATPase subunit E/Vma4
MGYQELIASLRKEGEQKIQAVRTETDAEAEKIRAETAGKIERIREEFRKEEAKLTKALEDDILSAAEKKARTIRLSAEKSLSDRLFTLALTCLHELRRERYESIFSALAEELPSAVWNEVRVNPEDVSMARTHFPASRIIPDNNIAGGLEVYTENKKQHIINTFEKRLERAWEEILPLLITDTYKKASKHGISSGH